MPLLLKLLFQFRRREMRARVERRARQVREMQERDAAICGDVFIEPSEP